MKTLFWARLIFVFVLAGLSLDVAYATFNPNLPRGERIVPHPVAKRHAEVCVVPRHFPAANYSDNDAKTEADLCAYAENSSDAVCPAVTGSNPGLDFFILPKGASPAKVQAALCKQGGAKKVAEYTVSSACSYTPAILAYYHVSRILGGIAETPAAVLRTFDVQNQISLGRKALAKTAPDMAVHKAWSGLLNELSAGAKSRKSDLLLTEDFTQTYGALRELSKPEALYKDFFSAGDNSLARAENFRDKNPIMALLANAEPVSKLVSREFTAENVQKMQQLKDAADMIVLDTLLSQQERFGNLHFIENYFYPDTREQAADGMPKLKSDKNLTPQAAEQLGAVQVKQLTLKDNGCGLAKQNVAQQAGLAQRLAHIDPVTYRHVLQFEEGAYSPMFQLFFVQGLGFTANDFDMLRGNLQDLAGILHQACKSGKLRLDLDLPVHFSVREFAAQACDV